MAVADAADAILPPAIRLRAGMLMREIVPRGAIRTIVLAHRPPSPLAEIGTPPLPIVAAVPSLFEPPLLMGEGALVFA
jgi:hypothetical protein